MAGVLTVGAPEDACNDAACVAAVQRATVRHLVLKDTQVERGGVLKTRQEPNFCAGAPAESRQGSCPGQFFDPADPTTDYAGGTWLHTVNGQVYPQIDVGAFGDAWRIVNASDSRSRNLSLAVQPTGQPLAFQLLAIDLAAATLAPREQAVPDVVTMEDLTPTTLSPTGQLLASSALQVPGADTLVAASAADAVAIQPSGPALQNVDQALGAAITPDLAAGKISNPGCKALAPGHRRKILFGFPKPTTFGLGCVEVDANGNDIEATRIPIGEFDPAQTVVCVPLPGGIPTGEVWELVNLPGEDHNFHIRQTRFFRVADGVAPGTTIPFREVGDCVSETPRPAPGNHERVRPLVSPAAARPSSSPGHTRRRPAPTAPASCPS